MKDTTSRPIRVGVFRDLPAADRAVERLIEAGFSAEHISVICPQCSADAFPAGVDREQPAGEQAGRAAARGGAIGAALGGLTAAAGLAATGGAAVLVAGPLLAAGAGAVAGGFVGAMTTRGFEPEIADYYDQALRRGRILVAVDTEPEDVPPAERAARVLDDCGAEPIALPEG